MLTRLFFASVRANAGRTALSVAGIALGVALGLAVHVINQSAISEMQQASRTLSGDADLSIRAGRESLGGFDERVFETVLADPRAAVVSPVLELDALPVGAATGIGGRSRQSIHFIGIDMFRAVRLQPGFVGELNAGEDRLALLQPNNVFLNRAARDLLDKLPEHAEPGTLQVISGTERSPVRLHIAGSLELPQYREPLAVMDIAGAQTIFNQTGRLTRIDLRLQPGVVPDSFRDTLAAQLPPGLAINTPAQTDRQSAAVSRAYRINLTVLSLVALFTGGFLVFSTQGLSVLRRRPQFALYRTLGVTRNELLRALLTEGAVLGAVGGVLGAGMGIGIAALVLDKLGGDLGSGFFAGVTPALQWQPLAAALFVLMGVAAGVVGAWLPARDAAAEPPARALKARDDSSAATRLPPSWVGITLLLMAGLLLALPAFDEIPWAAYAAIACLLFGVIALAPIVCARLLAALPSPRATLAQLAARHIEKSPGPSAAAITGIVASFSLMIAMLIMVVSFRMSLEQWLTGVLQADLYARAGTGEANAVDASTGAALAAIAGVARVDVQRYRSLALRPDMPPVTLIVRPIRDDVLQSLSVLQRADKAVLAPQHLPSIWVSEAVADLYGFMPGMKVDLPVEGMARKAIVAGIWRDYARSYGAIVVDRADYLKWTGDTRINDIAIKLEAGARKPDVIAAVRSLPMASRLEITDADDIRKVSLSVFDRSFAVTYALEVAAILVGLAGISATFSAQAWSRRREFGMLRHLGVTRREIAKLLGMEGVLLGAIGATIGLLLGIAIALILIFVVNRQSFHWSMELHIPWLALVVLSLVLIGLTALSATVSGRYALSKDAVLAVKDDE